MLIKTILNRIEKFKSFIYGKITLEQINGTDTLIVEVEPRRNAKGVCPKCGSGSQRMIGSRCVTLNMYRYGGSRYSSGTRLAGRTVAEMGYWWKLCLGLRVKSI